MHVNTAGFPSAFSFTSAKNGFEVNGAEGYGLYVGRADNDGVQVNSAGGDGVDAVTNTAANFGGNFRNTAAGGAGVRRSEATTRRPIWCWAARPRVTMAASTPSNL